MTINELNQEANVMDKNQIINHYRSFYSLSFEEYEMMEEMNVTELRKLFVEGEAC